MHFLFCKLIRDKFELLFPLTHAVNHRHHFIRHSVVNMNTLTACTVWSS